jgi:putative ABC transport system ATP-binding protein
MQKLAREQGCTILLVTHDNRILDIAVREAWAMPSRIVDMEDGRLINADSVALSV